MIEKSMMMARSFGQQCAKHLQHDRIDVARLRQSTTHTGTTREKKWKPKDARSKPPSDT